MFSGYHKVFKAAEEGEAAGQSQAEEENVATGSPDDVDKCGAAGQPNVINGDACCTEENEDTRNRSTDQRKLITTALVGGRKSLISSFVRSLGGNLVSRTSSQ